MDATWKRFLSKQKKETELEKEKKIESKLTCIYSHKVPSLDSAIRLREYAQKVLIEYLPSAKSIKKNIEKGLVFVNGQASITGYFIQEGDLIELYRMSDSNKASYDLKLELIFEDDHCAVINKPPGISVHSHGHRNIVNALSTNLNNSKVKDHLPTPMPVHRLDGQTSGLLIIAKSRSFQIELGKMLEQKKVKKIYTAIVIGKLEGIGQFNDSIEGKTSLTEYECLKVIESNRFEYLTLLKLSLHSGRTHQLRIHCANAGHPMLGEKLYATHLPNLKGKGLFLCATDLDFIHPILKKRINLTIDPPKKFFNFF